MHSGLGQMKFDDNGAGSSTLTVLMVTESIEPSGLGEHMITLAGALPPDVHATLLFPTTYAGLNSTRRARDAGLPVIALPLAALRQGTPTFSAVLDGVRPDIVHLHAGVPEEGHPLAAAARRWGARAVIRTEHNPYTLRTLKVRTPKVKAQEAAYAAGVRHVDRIICVSRGARLTYRMAHVAVPFSVVHNGIVPRAAATPRDRVRAGLGIGGEPLILTVGRFVQQKSHITLLDALPRLLAGRCRALGRHHRSRPQRRDGAAVSVQSSSATGTYAGPAAGRSRADGAPGRRRGRVGARAVHRQPHGTRHRTGLPPHAGRPNAGARACKRKPRATLRAAHLRCRPWRLTFSVKES